MNQRSVETLALLLSLVVIAISMLVALASKL